jgi:RND family efflux transporter MFP subunit
MESGKKSSKKIVYIVIAILLIVLVIIKLKTNKSITESKVYQYDKEKPINVSFQIAKSQDVKNEINYTGTFEPYRESKLSVEQQGKINSILVDVGSIVTKGQKLVEIDNALLRQQINSIDIQIEGLAADIKRYTVLASADAIQGIQLEKSQLALKSAQAQKSTLNEQLSKTTVYAPFDGIITAKLSEIGSFAAPGVPILQLTDIKTLKFTINVSENDIHQFKKDQECEIKVDAYSNTSIIGKLTMIGSKSNVGNSYPIQFTTQNMADEKIKAGMFGKLMLNIGDAFSGYIVPSSILIGSGSQPQIYIIKSGKAKLIEVAISKRFADKLLLTKGLNEGDTVITNGFTTLFDGANINVK